MNARNAVGMMSVVGLLCAGAAVAAPWMGYLNVFDSTYPSGRSGNYGSVKYYIDESKGETSSMDVYVEVWPDGSPVSDIQVEIFSNVNRRDFAKVHEPAADQGKADSYYLTYPMTYVGQDPARPGLAMYKATLPVNKCGAYRLTTRFRISNGPWQWHNSFQFEGVQQRDLCVVVAPKKILSMSMYEVNPLTVEASPGGTFSQRSTFEDFTDHDHDGFDPFNLDYVKNTLGFNTIWTMPIFPNTKYRWDSTQNKFVPNYVPGSPYAARNYYAVNESLDDANTQEAALDEFKYLCLKAEEKGINVVIDVAFNHAGRDVVYGQGAVDLGFCQSWEKDYWIREARPAWMTRASNYGNCDLHYREHATDAWNSSIFTPADRFSEHQWWDASTDFFFGDYSSLGTKPGYNCYVSSGNALDERDLMYTDLGVDTEVANIWKYFAYILPFWLEQTGNRLDGIRADFSQGLPPQAWEYIINKTRQKKWDFVFLAEALDPIEVLGRVNRHFDLMTTLDHWIYRDDWATMDRFAASLETEASTFGRNAAIMHNGTSHDELGNGNRWNMAARYAVAASSYGTPMVYMTQPLGCGEKIDFQYNWAHIANYWNNADPLVANMYGKINRARESSPALRSLNRHFLRKKSDNKFHAEVFSQAKWEGSELVLTFVKLRDSAVGAETFALPAGLPIDPAKTYQCFNLVSDKASQGMWGTGRKGSDILANGVAVAFSGNYTENGLIQFLKLEEVQPAFGVGGTYPWPAADAISPSNDVWINTQTWPIAPGQSAKVYWRIDGGAWQNADLNWRMNDSTKSHWHRNLGKFAGGAQVEYFVTASQGTTTVYDNVGGANYKFTVKGPALQWVGNVYHWPFNGSIKAVDDLWVNMETWPLDSATSATLVYSTDGQNWFGRNLNNPGVNGNNDWWHVNLGKFPAGTVIQYAIVAGDANGKSMWANNSGKNFRAVVQ